MKASARTFTCGADDFSGGGGAGGEEFATRVAALLKSEEQVALPGIVLQEVLSGVTERSQHDKLLAALRASFPLELATEGDHLKAADIVSLAAGRGMAVSTPDALIAGQALNRRASLFTSDADFEKIAALSGLKLV